MTLTPAQEIEASKTTEEDWTEKPYKYAVELAQWAEETRRVLINYAQRDIWTVTYRELFDRVKRMGEFDKSPILWRKWMGPVLEQVAILNKAYEEPIVTSMVVLAETKQVADGYGIAVLRRYGVRPYNPQAEAEIERAKVVKHFRIS